MCVSGIHHQLKKKRFASFNKITVYACGPRVLITINLSPGFKTEKSSIVSSIIYSFNDEREKEGLCGSSIGTPLL